MRLKMQRVLSLFCPVLVLDDAPVEPFDPTINFEQCFIKKQIISNVYTFVCIPLG